MVTNARRRSGWRVAAVAVVLFVAALALSGCRAPIDQPTAIQIASDFALKSQPAGTQIRGIRETSVSEVGNAWRIEISFEALAAGDASAVPEPHHLLIDVDKGSGTPTIVGQG